MCHVLLCIHFDLVWGIRLICVLWVLTLYCTINIGLFSCCVLLLCDCGSSLLPQFDLELKWRNHQETIILREASSIGKPIKPHLIVDVVMAYLVGIPSWSFLLFQFFNFISKSLMLISSRLHGLSGYFVSACIIAFCSVLFLPEALPYALYRFDMTMFNVYEITSWMFRRDGSYLSCTFGWCLLAFLNDVLMEVSSFFRFSLWHFMIPKKFVSIGKAYVLSTSLIFFEIRWIFSRVFISIEQF